MRKLTILLGATMLAALTSVPAVHAASSPGRLPSAAEQGYGNSGGEVVWWRTAPGYDNTSCTDVLNAPEKYPHGQAAGCRAAERR